MAHRLALVTAGATLLLIVAGGLVTNTGAGLAVPDWPTTFGHNMFLYPWSQMVGGVFYEHSHRLLGALVGLFTVGLGVTVWLTERRGWLRGVAAVAVVLVCLQGLLGGLRVVLLRDVLAIVHGCLAPAFFALTAALAVFTSPGWTAPVSLRGAHRSPRVTRRLTGLSLAVTAAVYGQIILGALTTHAGWVMAHVGGALVVAVAAAFLAGRVLTRHADERALAGPARAIGLLLGLQVALGLGAYVARFSALALPGGEVAVIGLPVAHRAMAALLFAAAVTLTLQARRLCPAGASGARGSIGAGAVSERVPA